MTEGDHLADTAAMDSSVQATGMRLQQQRKANLFPVLAYRIRFASLSSRARGSNEGAVGLRRRNRCSFFPRCSLQRARFHKTVAGLPCMMHTTPLRSTPSAPKEKQKEALEVEEAEG